MQTNNAFVLRNIYGKNILMPICTNSASADPILLNEVAANIWEMASKHKNTNGVVEALAKKYELKSDSPEREAIEIFLGQMVDMGLLFL